MSHMSKTLKLVTLERTFSKLSNSVHHMDVVHTRPKLFNSEYVQDRKQQTETITFEVRSHVST